MKADNNKKGLTFFQRTGLFIGLVLFLLIFFFDIDPGRPLVTRMAAVAVLMATWWITEAIPLSATSLLPLILYPLLGIMKGTVVAPIYINSTIFLFIGGFMIALTMEKWGLHKRIALWIIRLIGGGPSRIVLGFMIASAFLSMWISNTATALMMMPIGLAIILQLEDKYSIKETRRFAVSLMLGIAYSCSIGGIATLVGTPPNLSFVRIFQITFPKAMPVEFGQWMLFGVPLAILFLGIVWILLVKIFFRPPSYLKIGRSVIKNEYNSLGPASFEEKAILIVFFITAFLWVFRKKIELGFATIPGWSSLLPYPQLIDDGTVALFMAMILFFIPVKNSDVNLSTVMGSDVITRLPWNIVLLFGGGFALASGFQSTGLSLFIGNKFAALAGVSPFIMIPFICGGITFMTELTSNTATSEMILPVVASVASTIKVNPLLFMIPATISASCAFMMPVATPPNAIIFGCSRIRMAEMAFVGLIINIIGIILITIVFIFLGTWIFSIDPQSFPDWAGVMRNG